MRKRQKREAVHDPNRTHLSPLPTNQTLPRARAAATTMQTASPKRLRSVSTEFDENASHQSRKGKERAQTQPVLRQRKRKRSHALQLSSHGPSSDPNTSEDELISPNRILKRRLRSADTLHHDPGEEAEGEQSDSVSANNRPDVNMSDHECEPLSPTTAPPHSPHSLLLIAKEKKKPLITQLFSLLADEYNLGLATSRQLLRQKRSDLARLFCLATSTTLSDSEDLTKELLSAGIIEARESAPDASPRPFTSAEVSQAEEEIPPLSLLKKSKKPTTRHNLSPPPSNPAISSKSVSPNTASLPATTTKGRSRSLSLPGIAKLELSEHRNLRDRNGPVAGPSGTTTGASGKKLRNGKVASKTGAEKVDRRKGKMVTFNESNGSKTGDNFTDSEESHEETVEESDQGTLSIQRSPTTVSIKSLRLTSKSPSPVAHRTRFAIVIPPPLVRPRAAKKLAVERITKKSTTPEEDVMEDELEQVLEEVTLPVENGNGRTTRRTSNLSNSTISPPGHRQLRNGRSRRTGSPNAESSVYGDIESGVDGDVSEEELDEDDFMGNKDDESISSQSTRTLRNGKVVEPVAVEEDDEEVDMSFELEVEPELEEAEESTEGELMHSCSLSCADLERT